MWEVDVIILKKLKPPNKDIHSATLFISYSHHKGKSNYPWDNEHCVTLLTLRAAIIHTRVHFEAITAFPNE